MVRVRVWLRANGKALGVGGGFAGVGFSYLWNGTEQWRMARAISAGHFRPSNPAVFNDRFCLFNQGVVRDELQNNSLVCLIGLQSTGKTFTVQHILHEAENPFYMRISHDDVFSELYHNLRLSVWKLPWLADGLRVDAGKSHMEIVTEVFELVQNKTQKPVQLGLDVVMEPREIGAKKAVEGMVEAMGHASLEFPVHFPAHFDPKIFVKRIKYLCADARVASCLFSTSEGLQVMKVEETRLQKFVARELPLEVAKEYLEHIQAHDGYTEEMLKQIPRTFHELQRFARAGDKAARCQLAMGAQINKIKESKIHFAAAAVKTMYQKAAQQETIDVDDVVKVCPTVEKFVQVFVKRNIFGPAEAGGWRLQFDCTKLAAKAVFGW